MAADEAASPCSQERTETAGTHGADGSGRGERKRALLSPHSASVSRSNFPRTRARARTHTHTTPVKRMFFGWNSLRRRTHTMRTYTPHTRTASQRQHPYACTMTSSAQPPRAPALAQRGRTTKDAVALRHSLPSPTPSPLRHSRVSRHHNAPAALRVVGKSCGTCDW